MVLDRGNLTGTGYATTVACPPVPESLAVGVLALPREQPELGHPRATFPPGLPPATSRPAPQLEPAALDPQAARSAPGLPQEPPVQGPPPAPVAQALLPERSAPGLQTRPPAPAPLQHPVQLVR